MAKTKVLWSKTDISTIVNISNTQLGNYISENVKTEIGFKAGQQRFKDIEVYKILKDMFPLRNDAEIKELIGY
ncbi:hypothetical protein [Arcicella lustrica]|uniref:Uncharacterized protein n=1 Tax=Arcicella lustrica TaxID=2984196 RepID=A0ABU5SHQ1_9BACT|nr:hypothetical protein [Arcicella sp. DC25W]MEA5426813.1 hypothetical protein [Arcicella sp. DC25W]